MTPHTPNSEHSTAPLPLRAGREDEQFQTDWKLFNVKEKLFQKYNKAMIGHFEYKPMKEHSRETCHL